ncbi:MAG: amidohydrolase family protein [Treponema sp.]|nr:amidohydrolase family protein [Treponema sp.]
MTDWHIHIGQWHEVYYDPVAVVRALKAAGTEEFWLSSTSSCRYCRESPAVCGDPTLMESLPTARELHDFIKSEMNSALSAAKDCGARARPLYWVIPEVHFSSEAGVTVRRAMEELPYEGFKIHPRGNVWNMDDPWTLDLAHEVFSYSERCGLHVLIHTGEDAFERPSLFEPLIKAYPRVTVQLAHCRPLAETLEMLEKYPNVICDTAFVDMETQDKVRAAGFGERIRFGSDFPITHYFACHPDHDPTEEELTVFLLANKHK